jgi:hypothetical protein
MTFFWNSKVMNPKQVRNYLNKLRNNCLSHVAYSRTQLMLPPKIKENVVALQKHQANGLHRILGIHTPSVETRIFQPEMGSQPTGRGGCQLNKKMEWLVLWFIQGKHCQVFSPTVSFCVLGGGSQAVAVNRADFRYITTRPGV